MYSLIKLLKKNFRKNSLIKSFIFIFSVVILVPIITIGLIGYYKSMKDLKIQNEEYLTSINRIISNQLDNYITHYEGLSLQIISTNEVKKFVGTPEINDYDRYIFSSWIKKNLIETIVMQDPLIHDFYIISDNGNTYSIIQNDLDVNIDQLKLFLPENGDIAIITSPFSNIIRDVNYDSHLLVAFGRRIFSNSNSESTGAFVLSLRMNLLNSLWEQTQIPNVNTYVLDENNKIIYHEDLGLIGQPIEKFMTLNNSNSSNGNYMTTIDSVNHLIVYNTSSYTNWTVMSTIPMSFVQEPTRELRNILLLTAFNAFLLTMLIGYLLTNNIINPIKRLQMTMSDIGEDQLVLVKGPFPDNEVGHLMRSFNQMVNRIHVLIQKVYDTEEEKKLEEIAKQNALFQALQMQINPHFLYNTLGAISAYSLTGQQDTLQDMIEALSNMFRYAVQSTVESVVLSDELEHLNNYLLIQRYRSGVFPDIKWEIAKEHLSCHIIRLSLQPLVENIFHHAFPNGIKRQHTIIIRSSINRDKFIVSITDNGVGFDTSQLRLDDPQVLQDKWKHIGLNNIHKRIKIAFGESYGLSIKSEINKGTTIDIVMPYAD